MSFPSEYPTLREQLEAALHNIDCLHIYEDENALDYYRAARAKELLREAIEGLVSADG